MRVVIVILGLLVGMMDAYSQVFYVKDYSTHLPVPGANMLSLVNGESYVSNSDGKFVVDNLVTDDFFVISSVGYLDLYVTADDIQKQTEMFLFPRVNEIDPIQVVYSFGKEERKKDIPGQIDIIPASEIKLRNSQTSADILQSSGNVLVQKTQMGGGSPVLRGFEANRVLLVLDGVRMNNAIYRSGHLQNAITIDNNVLGQAEIIFGPGSVIYGSDALGGVVHYRTRNPMLTSSPSEINSTASLMTRFSSANQEQSFHVDASVGYNKFGFLTSVSQADYGDLRMGSKRDHGDSEWGLVREYVSRIDGVDQVLENPDPKIQKHTGYKQWDFLQKLLFAPNEKLDLSLSFNYSTSTEIPRFDRYNEYADGALRWAEWNYGPQDRLFLSVRADLRDSTSFFDEAHFVAAYQNIKEERIQRRFGRNNRETQSETVYVYSLNGDFEKKWKSGYRLNYGVEGTFNEVQSEAGFFNIETEEIGPIATRYPDGGSDMQTLAFYAQVKRRFSDKLKLNAGGRYSRNILNASFLSTEFVNLPFDRIHYNNGAFTGSIGLMYNVDSTWQVNALVSSGYRNPNIDDVGKVREKDGFVTVPNDEVRPEYAYNGELTVLKSVFKKRVMFTLTGYYTLLNQAIVNRPFQLEGADSLLVGEENAAITANMNADQAFLYGLFAGVKTQLSEDYYASATFNYTYGQDTSNDVPMSHIPPVFGRVEIGYQKEKFSANMNAFFNGKKDIDRYGLGTADNIDEALPDGTPAWWTLNAYSSFFVSQNVQLQFAVENILDKHYKQFASAISAPGRNFIFTCRATF